jgi:next-to-BRCA1 protein 1
VVAEFTLTAAAFTPTSQPPTETPTQEPPTATAAPVFATDPTQIALGTPGELCDDLSFDPLTVDVTILDGTPMTPGQDFVKTWKIKNTGACAWGDGYGLIYSYGEKMNGQPVPLGVLVGIGEEVEVSVNFKAPDKIGEYTSAWQMTNAKGITFGKAIFVKIVVN